MNPYLDIHPEVADALLRGKPVVALESTIIAHGMPWPQNLETAMRVQAAVREGGAVPATVALVHGRMKAGLSDAEIEALGRSGPAVAKLSRRDLALAIAGGRGLRRRQGDPGLAPDAGGAGNPWRSGHRLRH